MRGYLIGIGIFMLLIGAGINAHAFFMDITVSLDPVITSNSTKWDRLLQQNRESKRKDKGEDPNPRYVNESLIQKKNTQLIEGCFISIVGGLLLCGGLTARKEGS